MKKNFKRLYGSYVGPMVSIMVLLFFSTFASLLTPIINRDVIDKGLINQDIQLLLILLGLILALRLLDVALTYFIEKKRVRISKKMKSDFEKKAFTKLLDMKMNVFDKQNATSIINKLDVDISAAGSIMDSGFFAILTQAVTVIGGIIGLMFIAWQLLIVVLLFGVLKYFIINYLSKKNKIITKKYIGVCNGFAHWYSGIVNGLREIKIYDLKKDLCSRFSSKVEEKNEIKREVDMNGCYKTLLDMTVNYIMDFALYAIGGYFVYKNTMSIGNVFAFLSYSTYITNPISVMLSFRFLLSQLEPSIERFCNFLDEEDESENGSAKHLPAQPDQIKFSGLCFGYTAENKILRNVNAVIQTASISGIIGENGSGKTTVFDLLLRFYTPDAGAIEFDGESVENMALQSYRNLFSIVSQQVYLFDDTIRENIVLQKEVQDNKVVEAMEDCGLAELLAAKGLNYKIGENGSKLSGGERQKIGLARAIIQDRPIVLLDEATSNADVFMERGLEELLKKYFEKKTVMMITHKMNAYKTCEKIYFVSSGEIEEYTGYSDFLSCHKEYK